jgi:hypothetical protein
MDVESGTVFIDLGLQRGEPDSYIRPTSSTMPDWFPAAALAVLVLFCAAASAAPSKSPLTSVFRLEIGPADTFALTDDGVLLAQTYGQLSSYDLATGRIRWQAGQSTPAYRLQLADGLVLMRPWSVGQGEPRTTAIAIDNGVQQWERPGNVVSVTGSSTLLAVRPVRSQTGTNRRVEGPIDALDPLTGALRWTVEVPSSGVLLGVPGPADADARMLLVRADRTMALHDLDTGAQVAATTVPAADYDPDNPAVAGGVILLRHPEQSGMAITGYDPLSLHTLWSGPAYEAYEIKQCGVLACLIGPGGIRAVDPATGAERWHQPRWRDIAAIGRMWVAYGSAEGVSPVGIVDPDSGTVEVDLDGWRPVAGAGGGDHLLVTRSIEAGTRTMVAVARPGERQPRLLTDLPAGTGDCQAVPDRLVCRTMYGELVVWAYRKG